MRYLVLVLLLTGCAFAPELGMTEQSFKNRALLQSDDGVRLVVAEGDTRVYEVEDVFYYFVDGVLDRVDQGQLYEERVNISVN